MQGYFDIHSHILPGVDDGAKDMEETRGMLLTAYEEGIRIIVATPHYVAGIDHSMVTQLKEIYETVAQMAASVSEEFQIVLGNELLYNLNLIDALKSGEALTIDGTRYILVEFKPATSFREIWEGINHCIFAGYIPILAHIERYSCLRKDYHLVKDLINSGAYIQLNLSSIKKNIVSSGSRFCHRLLKRKWVHFLGTDCHDLNQRVPHAQDTVNFLRIKYGEETIRRLLWDNPMTMIEDKHL